MKPFLVEGEELHLKAEATRMVSDQTTPRLKELAEQFGSEIQGFLFTKPLGCTENLKASSF